MRRIRLLLLCDGQLGFDENHDDHLYELCQGLASLSDCKQTVTPQTRIRSTDYSGFENLYQGTVRCFDQIWVFANSTEPPLELASIAALTEFMRLGGGVFASGDHAGLGSAIGGVVPRIRQMRQWSAGPVSGPGIINTLIPVNDDAAHDEKDAAAKPIFPHLARPDTVYEGQANYLMHPLMRHKYTRVLRWLPDHKHEGNLALEDLSDFAPDQAAVSTVAWAMAWNQDGGSTGAMIKPRAVPVINCFDPKQVSAGSTWGPIVVDSTYHHFLNVNVKSLTTPELRDHWHSYLANLLAFLTPYTLRTELAGVIQRGLRTQLAVSEIVEEARNHPSAALDAELQNVLGGILARRPLSHRQLLLAANTQCAKTLCAQLSQVLCSMTS
jgi:hypothetical protein